MPLPQGLKTGRTAQQGITENLRAKQEPRSLHEGLRITLPLPNKQLSPNARCHWAVKAKHVTAYRQIAAMLGKQAVAKYGWCRLPEARVVCVFFRPTKRRIDKDNALASLKSAFDGLADAGIVENDCAFSYAPVEVLCDKDNPRVEIYVQETSQ